MSGESEVARLIAEQSHISDADDILALQDDDSGQASHKIKAYACPISQDFFSIGSVKE